MSLNPSLLAGLLLAGATVTLVWPPTWRAQLIGLPLAAAAWSLGLFNLVLLARWLDRPFDPALFAFATLILAASAALVRQKLATSPNPFADANPSSAPPPSPSSPWLARAWLILAVSALLALLVGALLRPLSGWDNIFRWDYLARHALALGHWNFYPPLTAADFREYGWTDGIPPLVPWLNAWLYALASSPSPYLIGLRVAGEIGLIVILLVQLARDWSGPGAGRIAVAAWCASPLAIWSAAMAQETAWLTITLLGLIWSLGRATRSELPATRRFWLVGAGLFAATAAVTRDYGGAWALLGVIAVLLHRDLRAQFLAFVVPILLFAAPWYLWCAWHTGHPLYPHGLPGWPVANDAHALWQADTAQRMAWSNNPALSRQLTTVLAALLLPAVLWSAGGAWCLGRFSRLSVGAIALVVVLWLWSIPATAGGWVYASRVLGPALALAAVLGAVGLASLRSSRAAQVAFILIAALTIDAGARWHFLPGMPEVSPWKLTPAVWQTEVAPRQRPPHPKLISILAEEAKSLGIVVDHPSLFANFRRRGAAVLPLWSPSLHPLFDPTASPPDVSAALQAEEVRFVLFDRNVMHTSRLAAPGTFVRRLLDDVPPTATVGALALWDLNLLDPIPAQP